MNSGTDRRRHRRYRRRTQDQKLYMRPLNQYTNPGTPRHTLCRCADNAAATTFTPERRIATDGATEVQINILSSDGDGDGGIRTAHKRQQTCVMNEGIVCVREREKRNFVILHFLRFSSLYINIYTVGVYYLY